MSEQGPSGTPIGVGYYPIPTKKGRLSGKCLKFSDEPFASEFLTLGSMVEPVHAGVRLVEVSRNG